MQIKIVFYVYAIMIPSIANAFDCNDKSLFEEQGHLSFSDNLGNQIFFRKIDSPESDIQVLQINCKTGIQYKVLELPFLGGSPEIAFAFPYSIDKNRYLFISQKIKPKYSITGIPYVDNYYLNYVLKMENNIYEKDDDLSEFFGEGGDIYDIHDINDENNFHPKISYLFPYKTEKSIKNELNNSLFKKWKKQELKVGRVNKKTLLQEVPNYVQNEKRYLVKGDIFKIKAISARWLNIVYKNSEKSKWIEGWIQCKDTSLCQ
ncbi:MAG: hypothetical protein Q4D78_01820 [Neisseria zoodegmatis]|uniref:hypothetical protein n=1 Tax=Neisseria zoodegmatis TaxID=326523 RepID=UPI0026F371C6|nr:hypothetical protein [Neisseria zoodegmatis]MDO5068930.1 hypothetical protein [Neisseria zoodegmatis]